MSIGTDLMPFGNIAWEDLPGRYPPAYKGTGWLRAGLTAPKQHLALDNSHLDLEAETLASRRSTQR